MPKKKTKNILIGIGILALIIALIIIGFLYFTFDETEKLCTSTRGMMEVYTLERQPIGDVILCGGFEGVQCPSGQTCKLRGNYPDAQGKCIEIIESTRCNCPDDNPYFNPSLGGCTSKLPIEPK